MPRFSFNSRSRMGSDIRVVVALVAIKVFQFALPYGERLSIITICANMAGFNSRSRMGSDRLQLTNPVLLQSFNSRSRMGSDYCFGAIQAFPPSFNSRSRMGSDRKAVCVAKQIDVSIRAPVWGATRLCPPSRRSTKFQFALPYGERPPSACKGFLMFSFNSRSRMESDSDRYAARHPGCSFNSRSRMESD